MKRSKQGLFAFPPKKTLIWRGHCSIGQWCCSMTSKWSIDWFLESSSGVKFFQPSVRVTNQKPRAFVSVRQTNQIALFPFDKPIKSLYFRSFVLSVLFALVHFKVTRKSPYLHKNKQPFSSPGLENILNSVLCFGQATLIFYFSGPLLTRLSYVYCFC